jgi:hypothetical protein
VAADATEPAGQIANAASTAGVQLIKPHPIIAKWLSDHGRGRREAAASRDPWRIRMGPAPLSDIDRRRHRILDQLFHALEGKGAKISEAEKGLIRVTIDDENIDFQIREKNRQVRVSQRAERARLAKQEERRRQRLGELARDWQTANLIRDFIAAIKSKPFEADRNVGGTSLAEWLAWAEASAAALDLTRDGPEGLFSIIASAKID